MEKDTLQILETIPDIDSIVAEAEREQAGFVEFQGHTDTANAETKAYAASQKYFLKCLARVCLRLSA